MLVNCLQIPSSSLAKARVVAFYTMTNATLQRREFLPQQQSFASGDVVQIACTSGYAFSHSRSFELNKNITCGGGTWETQFDANCVSTCTVRYSDHDKSVAVPVGSTIQAKCKTGYRARASDGQLFALCTMPRDLNATCEQTTPGSHARLSHECQKVTCGDFKAYPENRVTITPKIESPSSRFTDYNDENGQEAERTKIQCGKCCKM